jgi:murein DD-endopeptidase MepM/ murein hydrolase activator NlpD
MNSQLGELLLRTKTGFHPVVSFNPGSEKITGLNLTSDNGELNDNILGDIGLFSMYINRHLENAGARYAIGGYNEHRTVYKNSSVFDSVDKGGEPRRLHLGIDIWGKSGTTVTAPLDGIVHSFAFNEQKGDYGATIILSHILEGFTFYSLYGHLSLASIGNMEEGQLIKRGDRFAAFGIPSENGQWPPHLHFQLITSMDGYRGDYPGVCAFSERAHWLANSPDPDLILQLNQYLH